MAEFKPGDWVEVTVSKEMYNITDKGSIGQVMEHNISYARMSMLVVRFAYTTGMVYFTADEFFNGHASQWSIVEEDLAPHPIPDNMTSEEYLKFLTVKMRLRIAAECKE